MREKKLRVALTRAEWDVVLAAVGRAPDPEMFDFGPAYESAVKERANVAAKIRKAVARPD